jgi:hypothetical protein
MTVRPNFFVVGAPKSGTSALYEFVRQHPDVFVPERKELHYFTREHAARSYYHPSVITDEARYLAHFRDADGCRAAGDFSPSYLYFEEAARDIKRFDGDARIIAILRRPTERTISHYLMDVAKGFQDRPLSEFLERTDENAPYHFEYVETSLYSRALERYLALFGRDHVLVLTAEELSSSGAETCRRVFRFLDVDDRIVVRADARYNGYFEPRFAALRRLPANATAHRIYETMPRPVREGLKRALRRRGGRKPELADERRYLDRLFAPEAARLSELLGRDLSRAWTAPRRHA